MARNSFPKGSAGKAKGKSKFKLSSGTEEGRRSYGNMDMTKQGVGREAGPK